MAIRYVVPVIVIAFLLKAYVLDPFGDLLARYVPAVVILLAGALWLALVVSRWRAGDFG